MKVCEKIEQLDREWKRKENSIEWLWVGKRKRMGGRVKNKTAASILLVKQILQADATSSQEEEWQL